MKEDIIAMARRAGAHDDGFEVRFVELRYLERFAALVAAHTLANIDPSKFMSYQEAFEAGRLAEREACAEVCESRMTPGTGSVAILNGAAAAIRARGNT